jgi:site-specific DNA-methyltransferase (adenine-specific)
MPYQFPGIEVVHADVLECLDEIAGLGFDVVITDPPYSDHVHENMTSNGVVGGSGMGVHERDPEFEAITPELRDAIALLGSAANRWAVVFSDIEGGHEWRLAGESMGLEYIRTVPWIRWSQPQLSGDRPSSGSEQVIHFHKQYNGPRGGKRPIGKHWNGPGSLTHYYRRPMRGQDKHPTEKPIDLMLDLVSWYSDPGELVLDPCGGAGTTALACRLLGRRCVLLERKKKWAAGANGRAHGPLSARDVDRAQEWIATTLDEAGSVPEPRAADGSDVKTYERAQRRIADAMTVAEALGAK